MESKCKSKEFLFDGDAKNQNQNLAFIKMKYKANDSRSYFDKNPDNGHELAGSSSLNSLLNHNQNMENEKSMESLACDSSPWIMEGLPKDAVKQTAKIFEADVDNDHKLLSTTFTIRDEQFSDQAQYVYYTPTKCNLSPEVSPITALCKKLALCHLTETTAEPYSKEALKGVSQATTAGGDYKDFGNNNDSLNEVNVAIEDSPMTSLTKMMARCKLTDTSVEHVPEENKDANELVEAYPEENKYENELASPYIEQLPEEIKYVNELSGQNINHLSEENEDELLGAYFELVPEGNELEYVPEEIYDVDELSGLVSEDNKDVLSEGNEAANYYSNENEGQDDKLDGSVEDSSFSFFDSSMVNYTETEKILWALFNSDSDLSLTPIDNEIDEDFIDTSSGLDHIKNGKPITEGSLKNIVDSPLNSKVDFGDANNPRKSKKLKSLRVTFNDALTIFEYPSEKSFESDDEDENILGIDEYV